ncbi:hypothetical protein BMF94_3706 [Rhodotorula taiwanensis]|uniref:Uncharacterized protein n=1 Tax=Rhodotorula taiwanensis TaxID=741276 RepID=A0A2S5B9D7_9BASI|nr:hypothetical protein BMF94_3706 [Rhodotorula taiwanensis]
MSTLFRTFLVIGMLVSALIGLPVVDPRLDDTTRVAIEPRAIPNVKVAKTSSASITTTAVGNPKFTPIANPKANHGKWPTGIKVVPLWTVNGTTIWGVKPTHPGRPPTWPPAGSPTTSST